MPSFDQSVAMQVALVLAKIRTRCSIASTITSFDSRNISSNSIDHVKRSPFFMSLRNESSCHLIDQPKRRSFVGGVSRLWGIADRPHVAAAWSHVSHGDSEACKVHCGSAEDELLWFENDSIPATYIQPLGRMEVAPFDRVRP